MSKEIIKKENQDVVVYETEDGKLSFDVSVIEDTVWLTQKQMAELFDTTRENITLHLGNLFKDKEIEENSVCKDFLLTASDGKQYKTKHYNLDAILSIGYRIKSIRAIKFRQWATLILRQYMMNGVVINERRIGLIEAQIKVLSEKIDNMKLTANFSQEKAVLEQQIENKVQRDKVLQLADRVGELWESLEDFKKNYVVIKRPEEGGGVG
jgi:hypothetical protein